ncbi:Response regulator receiver domain-containing protein [Colwellia chukchiensis]|uniref:Response regulator receiver domain-containing protein n=1 Tax=Colwellia chukchiensis TaxID=641665 RepID=A0A1H7JJQ2_9GAMM|nr:response regulator [Colwellia chukchiensis]SEK74180.1 Response regulator receiver domain-containing protein [Colwellia chukchiensis]
MSTNVLICDDSNLARKQVLRSLPESLSTDVKLASNGEEALAILSSENIDILFLDLTMPIIDGLGVLAALKEQNKQLPVFVISADVQPEMQSKVLALGAKAFLRKPIQIDVLYEHLKRHGFL